MEDRLNSELALFIKFTPCSAISRRISETISRSVSSARAVPSKRGFDVHRRLFVRVSSRSLVRSPITAIALLVIPVKIGMRDFAFTRWSSSLSTASICVSSSNIARTGIPRLCTATNCSKLRRLPNIGNTAGPPFGAKKRGSSNQAARTFLAGCCPNRLLGNTLPELSIRATSDLGSPVTFETRLAAVRTALSLII